jgi:hypothetical protein
LQFLAEIVFGFTMGATPFIAPPDYLDFKFWLAINPAQSEIILGWTCCALYAIFFFVSLFLWGLEKINNDAVSSASSVASGNKSAGGRVTRTRNSISGLVSPFYITTATFCLFRVADIAVQLGVTNLYQNMLASFVLESIGNILFLLAFTFIAICWSKLRLIEIMVCVVLTYLMIL